MNEEIVYTEDNIEVKTGVNSLGKFIDLSVEKDTNIYINGVLVYSPFAKKTEYIPPVMRDFLLVSENCNDVYSYKEGFVIELMIGGMEVSAYVPTKVNFENGIHFRFTTIVSPIDMENILKDAYMMDREEHIEEIMANVNSAWEKMTKSIDDKGFEFDFSHDIGEGYYGSWDIIIKPEAWNQEKFTQAAESIYNFNKIIKNLEEKYSILD